jgi:hypothetical protein
MSYELLLAPQTGAATTAPKSFVETDQICVVANGLATTETVNVQIVSTLGATNVYGEGSTPFPYQLTATAQAIFVPGGYLYQFAKSATAAAVGIEVHFKPRVGGGAS